MEEVNDIIPNWNIYGKRLNTMSEIRSDFMSNFHSFYYVQFKNISNTMEVNGIIGFRIKHKHIFLSHSF